ncbi:hypothetical protein AB0D29_28730 [Streptomyces sp. NPDC048424]|uniref:hypothetical protein n=1 Tax=Streptomyces sp. NPDC048424 TaxID=3155265 RepID=UPI00343C6F5C
MMAIRIQTERDESYERPTRGTLSQLVERIGADSDHFVIVERLTADPDVYIQVWHDAGDDYQLEHRDGSADRHFQAYLPTAAEVVEVMARWARQEKAWDLGPTWRRLDLPVEEEPTLDARTGG